MDPFTMMMIAKGVQQGAQAGSRLIQPKFQNTRYGKLMRERSRSGNLSQAQEKNILDKVGTNAGQNAQVARNRYAGSAINQGMGNSVAIQRGLRETEADVRRTVTDTAKGIYGDEERAKSDAKFNYARSMDQDKAERMQAWGSMAGAGAGMIADHYGNKYNQQQAQDSSYTDAMNKYGSAVAYKTPSDQTRYQGGGFDPSTGEARGSLTLDDKRAVEVYAQKANIKNVSNVTNSFSALQNGEIDGAKFREQLKSGSDPLTDDEIDELFATLAKIRSK